MEWPFAAIKDFEKKVLNAFAILNAFHHASQLLFIASFIVGRKINFYTELSLKPKQAEALENSLFKNIKNLISKRRIIFCTEFDSKVFVFVVHPK